MDEFYKNVNRGFDASNVEIFARLKHTNFDDVLYPARETLSGTSGDNSCAMCVAPIALVCVKNGKLRLVDQVRSAAAVTHLHEMAVNGALLQANAIHELVKTKENLSVDTFLDQMIDFMKNNAFKSDAPSFVEQVQQIKKLLKVPNPSEERIVNVFGHSSQALYSVPTAMYCFLRGVQYPSDVSIGIQKLL